jgi:hypothetical protein
MARHETPVPSSPALLGAIVYDCFSLEARNREKGAQGARPSLNPRLFPTPFLHAPHGLPVGSITSESPLSCGRLEEMGPTVSLRSPWEA